MYQAVVTIGGLFGGLIRFVVIAGMLAIAFSIGKAALKNDSDSVSEAMGRVVGMLAIVAAVGAVGAIASWCIQTFAPTSSSLWEIITFL